MGIIEVLSNLFTSTLTTPNQAREEIYILDRQTWVWSVRLYEDALVETRAKFFFGGRGKLIYGTTISDTTWQICALWDIALEFFNSTNKTITERVMNIIRAPESNTLSVYCIFTPISRRKGATILLLSNNAWCMMTNWILLTGNQEHNGL